MIISVLMIDTYSDIFSRLPRLWSPNTGRCKKGLSNRRDG